MDRFLDIEQTLINHEDIVDSIINKGEKIILLKDGYPIIIMAKLKEKTKKHQINEEIDETKIKPGKALVFSDEDNINKVIHTKPFGLKIKDKTIAVKHWKDVLMKILENLYEINSEKLKELSEKYYRFKNRRIFISPKKIGTKSVEDIMNEPREINKTGIYIETNLNAKSIMEFITKMLNIYQEDKNDYIVYIK